VLLSVAVALLAKHEEELCTLKSMPDIFTRLQALGKEVSRTVVWQRVDASLRCSWLIAFGLTCLCRVRAGV
jgi:hypothetical protein